MEKQKFINQLQKEAELQAKLNRDRLLPRQLDPLTSIIGNYSWQVLLATSFLSAVLIELLGGI